MDKLKPEDDLTFEKILNNMLDGEHNLDLKSHIFKPKVLSSFVVFGSSIGELKYKTAAGRIDTFVKKYLRFMVSYQRLSRKEVTHALASLREESAKSNAFTKNLVT